MKETHIESIFEKSKFDAKIEILTTGPSPGTDSIKSPNFIVMTHLNP